METKGCLVKRLVMTGLSVLSLVCMSAVPKVILDTDMYTDFDDVGALAVLHSLADAGECEILGTVVSTSGKAPSSGMVELLNNYYGRPALPIGSPKAIGIGPERDGGARKNRSYRIYEDMVAHHSELKFPRAEMTPDANDVYRRLLAAAPDRSVVVVSVGFTTNLRRLLETKADNFSPHDGRTLVTKKVMAWYAMACKFPSGQEYNSGHDAASSAIAFREWPTPIYFLDYCYGAQVRCGVPVSRLGDMKNPVCKTFARALRDYKEEDCGHSAWDEITVLAAVRGWERYFGIERGRFDMGFPNGCNHWTKCTDGNHYVLTEKLPKKEVGKIVDELMASAGTARAEAHDDSPALR